MIKLLLVTAVVFLALGGCAWRAGPTDAEPPQGEAVEAIEAVEFIEVTRAIVVVEAESSLAIRQSPGTTNKPEGDVLDRVPRDRILTVKNRHENSMIADGYTWWEVEDTVTQINGWSASEYLQLLEEN